MADLFQIGLSGIYSSQAKLNTTSHNIANISTEGYSRQSVVTETAGAERYGDYFIGRGSSVAGVERAYDQFAFTENNLNTSKLGYATEIYQQNNQMDMLLSDQSTSITQPVLQVFEGIGGVADNPNMLESRTVFLESAGNMVSQYNRLYDNLEIQYSSINNDIVNTAQTVSEIAENLANLNKQISIVVGNGGNSNANDLLDQRDKAINDLSTYVDVSVVTTGNAMINVYIGSGQSLVMGGSALQLTAVNGDPDPLRKELALKTGDNMSLIDGQRLGGKISAMFDTRNNDLERAFNQLGQNVIGLTHSINEQQKEGMTLEGEIGDYIFNDVNSQQSMESRVLAHDDGLGEVNFTVRIDDLSALTPDEFDLVVDSYDGATGSISFTSTNRSTGKSNYFNIADLSTTQRIDIPESGLSLGIDSITSLTAGKQFTLRPTRLAAQEATLQHKDASKVAAADSEIKTTASTDNTGSAVLRTSAIVNTSDALYLDEDNPLVTIDITAIDATSDNITYNVLDKNGDAISSLDGSIASVNSETGKLTFELAGVKVELISGSVEIGNQFSLNYNETGDGDNRNIMKMADLQTQKIMNDGKATFADVYNGMLSEVGAKTANADITLQSATIMQTQSFDRVQSMSGVNMDEEASNLLQFQQHYSAAARVISVASEIFDTILQAAR